MDIFQDSPVESSNTILCVSLEPIKLFCNREIIETYLNLYDTEFSYDNDDLIDWNDNKVRVNMKGEVVSKKSYLSLED